MTRQDFLALVLITGELSPQSKNAPENSQSDASQQV